MKKLPPLIELRAFDAAARHLSFKKAAAELGVTPTAISHQIRLLEQYCGRPLFRRRPRPMSLTEPGARLFPVIRDGLEAFATAIAAVKRDHNKQPLRVTTTNAFASRWLVPRLPRWRKEHPNTPLDVIGTDNVIDLNAGDADVAIRYARVKNPLDRSKASHRFGLAPIPQYKNCELRPVDKPLRKKTTRVAEPGHRRF